MAPKTDVGFVCYTPECLKPVFLCPVCDSHHSDVDLLRDHLASHEINSNKVSFPVKAQWFRSITDDSRDSTWLFVDIPLDEYLKYTTDRLEKCLRGEGVVVNVPIKTELSEELLDTDYHENDMDDENDEDGEEDGGDDEDYMEEEDEDEEEEEEDSRLKDEDDQSPSPVAGPSGTSTNPPDTTNTTSTSLENSETTVLRPRKRGRPRKSQTTKERAAAADRSPERTMKSCEYPGCFYRTGHPSNMSRHTRTHTGGFQCTQCDSSFLDKHSRRIHVAVKHDGQKLVCDKCDAKFSSISGLNNHKARTHGNQPKFSCHICNKPFYKKMLFSIHINAHYGKKLFNCSKCHKEFTYQQGAKVHEKSCPGVPKYRCEVCEDTFTNLSSMKEHFLSSHSNFKVQCSCGKSFSWRPSFNRHKQSCKMRNAPKSPESNVETISME